MEEEIRNLQLLEKIIPTLNNEDIEYVEYVLAKLLIAEKIDYIKLSNAYMNYLKEKKHDDQNKICEASNCIFDLIYNRPNKTKEDKIINQRSLYFLNQNKNTQMKKYNEKYGYNEDTAKQYSWYERNKKEEEENDYFNINK